MSERIPLTMRLEGQTSVSNTRRGVLVDMKLARSLIITNELTMVSWFKIRKGSGGINGMLYNMTRSDQTGTFRLFVEPLFLRAVFEFQGDYCTVDGWLQRDMEDHRFTVTPGLTRQVVVTKNKTSLSLFLDGALLVSKLCAKNERQGANFDTGSSFLENVQARIGSLDVSLGASSEQLYSF